MSNKIQVGGNGVGFFGLLTIVFIILKLTGHISWSWFWVISPMLVPVGIVCLFILVAFLAYLASSNRKRW